MRSPFTVATVPTRQHTSFGGLLPTTAVVHDDAVSVAVLGVEHHRDGCAVPLLVLAQTPGVLAWNLDDHLSARDDVGTEYRATSMSSHAGLGSLQTTAWLTPAVPAAARRLTLEFDGIRRVSSPRGGVGIERTLSGGSRNIDIDLCPTPTRCEPPAPPPSAERAADVPRTPTRSVAGFEGVLPVGQTRFGTRRVLCAWAIERYEGRAVFTGALLHEPGAAPRGASLDVWDDRGTVYECSALHEASFGSWTEVAHALTPGIDPAAERLGVRVSLDEEPDQMTIGVRGPGAVAA